MSINHKTKHNVLNKYFYALILAMLASVEAEAQQMVKEPLQMGKPRLVVNIVVDQLCNDNLDAYLSLCGNDGFKKLLSLGKVYKNGKMPFIPLDCASATAAISSGSYPFYNGIPSSEWISRKTTLLMSCTSDQKSLLTPRGNSPSPVNLLSSTLSDELKVSTEKRAKVYGIAVDSEAAIFLAGHCGDGAYWIDNQSGKWLSSEYYSQEPSWLQNYNATVPASKKVKSAKNVFSGNSRFLDYKRSSLVNGEITNLALECVSNALLGSDNDTDLLSIQYYAGQPYKDGKIDCTQSVRDTYLQLDTAIGKLLSGIENRVGRNNVLFVLSSTGYKEEQHTDYSAYNVPCGTVYINRTANLLNMYLSAIYGQAHYVEGYHINQIYLDRKAIERRKLRLTDVLERCKEILIMSDGISDAKTIFSLMNANDENSKMMRNGMSADVSGDIIIETFPGWKIVNENLSRTYPAKQYGLSFPIVFYGAGIEKETLTEEVTADRIAPTISKSIHIRAPNACKATSLK